MNKYEALATIIGAVVTGLVLMVWILASETTFFDRHGSSFEEEDDA